MGEGTCVKNVMRSSLASNNSSSVYRLQRERSMWVLGASELQEYWVGNKHFMSLSFASLQWIYGCCSGLWAPGCSQHEYLLAMHSLCAVSVVLHTHVHTHVHTQHTQTHSDTTIGERERHTLTRTNKMCTGIQRHRHTHTRTHPHKIKVCIHTHTYTLAVSVCLKCYTLSVWHPVLDTLHLHTVNMSIRLQCCVCLCMCSRVCVCVCVCVSDFLSASVGPSQHPAFGLISSGV